MANVSQTDQIVGDGPGNLMNYGGMPEVLRKFEVKEKPQGNQPEGGGTWDSIDAADPLGPK